MTNSTAATIAVEHGAALLDERIPDWVGRIDLNSLDIASCSYCVLGQLDGDRTGGYTSMLHRLTIDSDDDLDEWAQAHGFDTDFDTIDVYDLTNAWKALIEQRRAEGGQ